VLRAEIVTRLLMVVLALVAVLGVFAADCGGGGNHTSKTKPSTSTTLADQQQGSQIFQARCASCHDARLAAQVTRDFPNIDDEIAVVTNGRTSPLETMPSFGGALTPKQIRGVSTTHAASWKTSRPALQWLGPPYRCTARPSCQGTRATALQVIARASSWQSDRIRRMGARGMRLEGQ